MLRMKRSDEDGEIEEQGCRCGNSGEELGAGNIHREREQNEGSMIECITMLGEWRERRHTTAGNDGKRQERKRVMGGGRETMNQGFPC